MMNQGIIIEVGQAFSIALSEGIYYKIKNKRAMTVGMNVLFTEEDRVTKVSTQVSRAPAFRYASLAASFVLVLMMGLMYYNNNLAVFAVVTMDINPSVEVSLNKNNKVIRVEALNEDGAYLLDVEVDGWIIDDAIALLLAEAKKDGFVEDDQDAFVVITTIALKGNVADRTGEIEALLAGEISENDLLREITVAVIEATEDELKEAKASNKPVPLVAMKHKNKMRDATTVKEVFEDETMMQEMAEEGSIYNKYGNSITNRNDLKVLLDKLGEDAGDALIAEFVGKDGSLDDLNPEELKGFRDRAKELMDDEKSPEEKDVDSFDNAALRAIIDKLKSLKMPNDHTYDGDPQKDVEDYLGRTIHALDGEKEDDKALEEEGRNLLKALQKAGIKAPNLHEEDSEMLDDEDQSDQPNKKVPDVKTNNGRNNNQENNGKKISDVEESVTEVVIENDEDVEVMDENKEETTKADDGQANDDKEIKGKEIKDKEVKD